MPVRTKIAAHPNRHKATTGSKENRGARQRSPRQKTNTTAITIQQLIKGARRMPCNALSDSVIPASARPKSTTAVRKPWRLISVTLSAPGPDPTKYLPHPPGRWKHEPDPESRLRPPVPPRSVVDVWSMTDGSPSYARLRRWQGEKTF